MAIAGAAVRVGAAAAAGDEPVPGPAQHRARLLPLPHHQDRPRRPRVLKPGARHRVSRTTLTCPGLRISCEF